MDRLLIDQEIKADMWLGMFVITGLILTIETVKVIIKEFKKAW